MVNTGLSAHFVYCLAIDSATTPAVLYAGTHDCGVYRSADVQSAASYYLHEEPNEDSGTGDGRL
jgi:hypothetical protein